MGRKDGRRGRRQKIMRMIDIENVAVFGFWIAKEEGNERKALIVWCRVGE